MSAWAMPTTAGPTDESTHQVQRVLGDLVQGAETLSALIVALGERARLIDISPALSERVAGVVQAMGLDLSTVSPERAAQLAGLGGGLLAQSANLSARPEAPETWNVVDASVLDGLGAASAPFAVQIKDAVAPRLEGLSRRLSGEATILDVGAGVAALSVALATVFPTARIVGIDVWEPSLARARANIEAAGMAESIVVRRQDVCDLADRDHYDMIWFAGPFIPADVQPQALRQCARALKPGGWLLYGAFAGHDPLSDVLADLRTLRSGGPVLDDEGIASQLGAAGLVQVTPIGVQVGLPSRIVAGRRG